MPPHLIRQAFPQPKRPPQTNTAARDAQLRRQRGRVLISETHRARPRLAVPTPSTTGTAAAANPRGLVDKGEAVQYSTHSDVCARRSDEKSNFRVLSSGGDAGGAGGDGEGVRGQERGAALEPCSRRADVQGVRLGVKWRWWRGCSRFVMIVMLAVLVWRCW